MSERLQLARADSARARCVSGIGAAGAWIGLCLLAAPGAPARAGGEALNADELARLERGELVERFIRREQRGLRLSGGTSWQVIDARPEVVWRALNDTRRYYTFLPGGLESRLVESKGNVRVVLLRQGMAFIESSYYVRLYFDDATHGIRFVIDDTRPHRHLKAGWGFYSLRSYGRGRSLLTYGLLVDFGTGPVSALIRSIVEGEMLDVPLLVKRSIDAENPAVDR